MNIDKTTINHPQLSARNFINSNPSIQLHLGFWRDQLLRVGHPGSGICLGPPEKGDPSKQTIQARNSSKKMRVRKCKLKKRGAEQLASFQSQSPSNIARRTRMRAPGCVAFRCYFNCHCCAGDELGCVVGSTKSPIHWCSKNPKASYLHNIKPNVTTPMFGGGKRNGLNWRFHPNSIPAVSRAYTVRCDDGVMHDDE